ncbi:substrate-binding periplasmic protein [Thalassotalea marina]|uniref:Periplasmic solute-binding protein n=1 Tax=Thalassotalea marina TaxID=1673741 RepID=A0A919BMG8_9GAMM|nr:transporter substrate-binding domain-containing protein [Thalassotalea marina]GHG00436.1 periplasmic solute-binding protein [Thalassotalea marina]
MWRVCLFCICLYSSVFVQANSINQLGECAKPLKLSLTTDWFPYVNRIDQNTTTGVDVELLKATLANMGCQLEIVHFPERRTLFELTGGYFDIGLGASRTAKREKSFHYSIPYRVEHNRFAYRADDLQVAQTNSLAELIKSNKAIGINLAGWYGDELEQAKRDYNGFVFSDTAVKRLKMLQLNRVDLVIDDDVVLCSVIHKEQFKHLVLHPLLLSKADIHFIFNKQSVSHEFVAYFNQALAETLADGELTGLFNSYVDPGCLPENID